MTTKTTSQSNSAVAELDNSAALGTLPREITKTLLVGLDLGTNTTCIEYSNSTSTEPNYPSSSHRSSVTPAAVFSQTSFQTTKPLSSEPTLLNTSFTSISSSRLETESSKTWTPCATTSFT